MCHVHRTGRRRALPSRTGVPRGRNVTGLAGGRRRDGAAAWRRGGAALWVGCRRGAAVRPSEAAGRLWAGRSDDDGGSVLSRQAETSSRWASSTDTVARVAAPKLAVLSNTKGREMTQKTLDILLSISGCHQELRAI